MTNGETRRSEFPEDEKSPPEFTVEPIVSVRNLKKNYETVEAVKGISFDIKPGEIFGLIGPDGAGKTSIFHILGGVMERTAGEVTVLGKTPRIARPEIGYLTQLFSLYLDLSIDENIKYIAGLREVPDRLMLERRKELLSAMSLDRFGSRLAGQLSGGMKQKLALCCALIARPKLLLLDEPTTGVDPVSRREFWDLLAEISQTGVTVAVATPYLDEAERCNRLILIHEGEAKEMGSPSELKKNLGLHRLEVRANRLQRLEENLEKIVGDQIADVQRFGDRLDVLCQDQARATVLVERIAGQVGSNDLEFSNQEPTLENVFVNRLRSSTVKAELPSFPFISQPRLGPSDTAIYAKNLRKVFGQFQAVKGVSLSIDYGQIYGLLGANGAGKTTTIKMLCGLLPSSSGEMILCGQKGNLRSAVLRQRLGYMSQKFTLYDDLTIIENLNFYCGVYCVPPKLQNERIDWVLNSTGLIGQEKMLTGKLPGGWKQRLAFAAAVLHQPEVLFLDEPTSGVDPLARREMWKLIRELAHRGTAILVTTHFLEEAEHCSKLGLMVAGEVVAEGSPTDIKEQQPGQLFELKFDDTQKAYSLLKTFFQSWRVSFFADSVHVVLEQPDVELEKIRKAAGEHGLVIEGERQVPFSLEDAFIGVVQRAEEGAAA
jgi:ABC-type multidrug transport system, ATPase component